MQRINDDEIFFENIPLYGSNIVTKGSSGLGGEIYFNISDIDFFGGNVNSTETIAGKAGRSDGNDTAHALEGNAGSLEALYGGTEREWN